MPLLLSLLALCLTPSSAPANSYHDFLCRIPYGPNAGHPAPTDDVTYATNGGFFYAGDGCEGGGSLYAQMVGETTHPYGTGASDTFTTPAGLTISGFTIWRYEADGPSQPYGSPASNLLYSPGPPSVQGLCAQSLACSSRGTPNSPFDPSNAVSVGSLSSAPSLSGVTQIQWSAACGGGPGGECPASGPQGSGSFSSQYDVYAADIDLVDSAPPTVSAISGPLIAGGALTGTQAVSFNAADAQSGVYSGSLVVDGHTLVSQILDTNGGACQTLGLTTDGQRSFEHAQPCKSSLSASLTLNTNLLTPGQHSLELIVDDAAGNQTIAYNGTITTSGSPSPSVGAALGPCSPATAPGAPASATSAAGQAKLTARWGSTAKALRVSRYGALDQITGRLATPAGAGIAGATIAVCEIPAYHGAPTTRIAGVHTGPLGQWTLRLPRDVASSTLRFVYPSAQNEALAAASATLRLNVHAGIALRIAPHITSVGHRIFFSGTLRGAPIPEGGKQLVLEASSGGEWIQFDTIGTDARGRYHATYRFKFPGPATYRFRVLSRHEADFPYLVGASNVVTVHER